jgi:hypothetical protein
MQPIRIIKLIIIVLAGLFLVAGCGGDSSTSDIALQEAQIAATQVALEATQAALAAPTLVIDDPPPADEPDAEPPVDDSIDSQAPAADDEIFQAEPFYVEQFDTETIALWTWFLFEGNEDDVNLNSDGEYLIYEVGAVENYSYFVYDEYTYADVIIETSVESLVSRNYANTLICRVSERGWYEFVVSNNGLYTIYKYDVIDNAWINLANGGSTDINTGKAVNNYALECVANQINVYVNGTLVKSVEDSFHKEGKVGVGISSFDTYPIIAYFDWIAISPAQ